MKGVGDIVHANSANLGNRRLDGCLMVVLRDFGVIGWGDGSCVHEVFWCLRNGELNFMRSFFRGGDG